MVRGVVDDECWWSFWVGEAGSSESAVSTLAESSGMSLRSGHDDARALVEVAVVDCDCGSQQNVSRAQTLQLKFSRRRPSSSD